MRTVGQGSRTLIPYRYYRILIYVNSAPICAPLKPFSCPLGLGIREGFATVVTLATFVTVTAVASEQPATLPPFPDPHLSLRGSGSLNRGPSPRGLLPNRSSRYSRYTLAAGVHWPPRSVLWQVLIHLRCIHIASQQRVCLSRVGLRVEVEG